MNKLTTRIVSVGLFAIAVGLAAVSVASAATIVTDSFSYPAGNLVQTGSPWTNFSGSGTDIQVTGSYAIGNENNAPDDQLPFAAQPTTSATYACFQAEIPSFTGAALPTYFALLKDTGTTNFFSRVYVMPLAAGGWTFGLSFSATSSTVGPVLWASAMTNDVYHNIVIKYDPVALTSTMWVDPVNESSTSISQSGTGTAVGIAGFALRQSSSASTLPSSYATGTTKWLYYIDNLGVGTTFNDACGQATPTRGSTWGQLKAAYH